MAQDFFLNEKADQKAVVSSNSSDSDEFFDAKEELDVNLDNEIH